MTRPLAALVVLASAAAAAAGDIDRFRPYLLADEPQVPSNGAVRVTYFGTSTLLFDDGETQVLIDGFFTRPNLVRAGIGLLETNTRAVDEVIKWAGMDRLKAVFVAHSHYDHALDCGYVCKTTKAQLHGSKSTLNVGRGADLPEDQLRPFEPGKEVVVGKFTVVVRESKHTPAIKWVNDDLGQTIDAPLRQPGRVKDYKEGGAFDFVVSRGGRAALVKPSTNYVPGGLAGVKAEVLFLGTATLAKQSPEFQKAYYDETVGTVKPRLVVPVHWDNFFKPLSTELETPVRAIDDVPAGFDYLTGRTKADGVTFGILQGYRSVQVFKPGK
jgi:L-ascorbate metabolism protein UlaG (beta-lactamase superfamily)